IQKKQAQAVGGAQAQAPTQSQPPGQNSGQNMGQGDTGGSAVAAAGNLAVAMAATAGGFPLAGYWQGHGMRPLGTGAAAAGTTHGGTARVPTPAPSPGAGIALSPYTKIAALMLPHNPAVAPPTIT